MAEAEQLPLVEDGQHQEARGEGDHGHARPEQAGMSAAGGAEQGIHDISLTVLGFATGVSVAR
jgi:hypothetical protein